MTGAADAAGAADGGAGTLDPVRVGGGSDLAAGADAGAATGTCVLDVVLEPKLSDPNVFHRASTSVSQHDLYSTAGKGGGLPFRSQDRRGR